MFILTGNTCCKQIRLLNKKICLVIRVFLSCDADQIYKPLTSEDTKTVTVKFICIPP